VVQVTIGEVHGQGVRIASRCLWDTETDNHASSTFQNPYLYCVAMVFAVYFEVMPRLPRRSRFLPHAVFSVTLSTAHSSPHITLPPIHAHSSPHITLPPIHAHPSPHITLPPIHVASSVIFHGWSGKFFPLPVRVGAPACNCILLPAVFHLNCIGDRPHTHF
jgi:hypothetical protein